MYFQGEKGDKGNTGPTGMKGHTGHKGDMVREFYFYNPVYNESPQEYDTCCFISVFWLGPNWTTGTKRKSGKNSFQMYLGMTF